ncbi:MAG: hypothetical protein IKZ74_06015 [Clostridiales bacterium]|nr:hypothetical protein [Clostridiales bacterium]
MKKFIALALSVATILSVSTGCKKKLPKFELELGDTITMGEYQGEEIKWEVMHRNFVVGENKVIVELQSTTAIDCLPFDEEGAYWEDCTLREWLNTDFYDEAFSKSEKKEILDTSYSMYTGPSRWLTDKVYISGEFLRYRLSPQDATCKPSKYAKKKGIHIEDGSCKYWTRDVGIIEYSRGLTDTAGNGFVFCLGTSGMDSGHGPNGFFTAEDVGVRPWISVEYEGTFEMKDINPADRVIMGTYDGEPITWIVIESEKSGLKLLSKYGLEKMKMDKNSEATEFADTDLHEWLNEDFYEEAFSTSEKKLIVANEEDDNVSLIGKISMKDGFDRECMNELIIGTGYSKAYCESNKNKVTENDAVDTFWMNYVSEKNQKLSIYMIGRLQQGGTDANQEFSVRPYITIKF